MAGQLAADLQSGAQSLSNPFNLLNPAKIVNIINTIKNEAAQLTGLTTNMVSGVTSLTTQIPNVITQQLTPCVTAAVETPTQQLDTILTQVTSCVESSG
jgi:hypothetical protein